jgi:hypothetical protein
MSKSFSFREGLKPFNFYISWGKIYGFYIYLFGLRFSWFNEVK